MITFTQTLFIRSPIQAISEMHFRERKYISKSIPWAPFQDFQDFRQPPKLRRRIYQCFYSFITGCKSLEPLNIQIQEQLTYSCPMAHLLNEQSRLGYLKPANPVKAGIFYNKDQKILALEHQNQSLTKHLEKQLAQYNELIKSNQEAESKFNRMKNQQSLLEVQQQMLMQSVEKLSRKVQENSPIIKGLTQKVEEITEENSKVQQELEEQLKISNENEKLIKRYQEQIKTQKLMLKSQKNITKIAETFKKNYENNQKYMEILENKLESKKKYLSILTKKAEKQKKQEAQQAKGQKDRKSTISMNTSKTKMSALTSTNFNTQKQQKVQVKSSMKSYNDLIRKKNAILAQRK